MGLVGKMNIRMMLGREFLRIGRNLLHTPEFGDDVIHFLHIGKCAGTQIGNVIDQVNKSKGESVIVKNGHDVSLMGIPRGAPYFFSIRHPLTRFVSGFYSRKRKGRPRIYSEWTSFEEYSFGEFVEASDLAESLFDEGMRGRQAVAAVKSIRHTAQNQFDWFCMCGAFLFVRPPLWIIRQECFEKDLREFMFRAGFSDLADQVRVEKDSVRSHANDYSGVPALSDKAKQNLLIWYSQDVQFYRMCEDWMEAN
ncbi:Sulfotransferase family protein [Ectothiorhodospira mobilis]|uniref:Sulfotransferase family protein n=2 Tax=Ectothiorhodospira mobilis TaxID=195064 RepID=A0A1I4P6Z5_ECTMO|nr:Sulfotransferase family protein [Ectothiorhodospira mobilis]